MFLEKLKIQGFKSFANKNLLIFPGLLDKTKRGLTAIVGPNGSGKSNTADAIRWALGEQSMKTLRGKKTEDVIFSGSDKKGRLGMAEVSLYLNNEDGQAPIDYSEIVITRRLYRSGDSEYLLNNNKVRLSDVQMLLAKAKFGQKTYSVIGQGMVEGFLNTSLAERKEFFDEATGVKQYQIKRDETLKKLRHSYENLSQARLLLSEIEPRLKSLTRQVIRLKKRGEIEENLKKEQLKYYSFLWHQINNNFSNYNKQYLELEKEKFKKEKKLYNITQELNHLETENIKNDEFSNKQKKLQEFQEEKEKINKKLAQLEARMEIKLENKGEIVLPFLINRKEKIEKEIKNIKEEIELLKNKIKGDKIETEKLYAEKQNFDLYLKKASHEILLISRGNSQDKISSIGSRLKNIFKKLNNIKEENDFLKLKNILQKTALEIKELIDWAKNDSGIEDKKREKAEKKINDLTKSREEILIKINDNNLRFSAHSERIKLLENRIFNLTQELLNTKNKLKQRSQTVNFEEINAGHNKLKEKLILVEEKIKNIQTEISSLNEQEKEKRKNLFILQRNLQNEQDDINKLSNKLNDLKINSTRYETKLESLEIEAREELNNLKQIKETKPQHNFNLEESRNKIKQFKRQIELIGGIDPQIEKEYKETKERFDFLSSQVNDLTKAISGLEKIIKELDEIIKKQFDKEFKIIAEKFSEYFQILFSGGKAKIAKVMNIEEKKENNVEDNSNHKNLETENGEGLEKIKFLQKHNATGLAGIEIQATPPGKKIKSIAMLSGGERALTAIALICAIISANPSPFVVLDEVDAALDESNSERLAKILDELSHKTQFIVITHNRASMRRASILYGVTMGNDGISKMLSVKLEDITLRAR